MPRDFGDSLVRCPRCKKEFRAPGGGFIGRDGKQGHMCRECFALTMKAIALQRGLLEKEFSLDNEDEQIARQMHELLAQENSGWSEHGEELLTELAERMLKEEKRRKKIITQIIRLQKKKQ